MDDALPDGYNFEDGQDVAQSAADAQALGTELDADGIAAEACAVIRAATEASSSTSKRKRKRRGEGETLDVPCNDLQLLEETTDLVRSMHASSSAGIALTDAEIDEEALLMLIRKKNESRAATARAQEDELDAVVHAAAARSAGAQSKYKCFENDAAFLEELTADPETESEIQSDASLGETGVPSENVATARAARALRKTVAKWEAAVTLTMQSFVDREQRMQRGPGHNDEVSLLVTIPAESRLSLDQASAEGQDDVDSFEIVCVKWSDPSKRQGRIVRIDKQYRIVYAAPHLFGAAIPSLAFGLSQHEDLVHATGAQSRKYKGGMRDALPDLVQRFLLLARMVCAYANEASWLVA